MKNSRTSLNKPFYDWIKQVREAEKKIAELEDKLCYYNVKLIGYNSPNFEPRISSTKSEYKDNRYIWLEKINKIERNLDCSKKIVAKFWQFLDLLNPIEKKILKNFYIKKSEEISHSYKYKIINDISRKFNAGNKVIK